jgi:transcription termination/antitermination protein NusG
MIETSEMGPSISGLRVPDIAGTPQALWYAIHVRSRHERQVGRQLEERQFNYLLPVYRSVRKWKDRRKELDLVLFPGYVFVNLELQNRLRVLQIPGVARFVSFQGAPVPLSLSDVEFLSNGLAQGVRAEPHPYLKAGRRVRVKHGPLSGMEGVLVRKKEKFRLVISLELIMRSVMVEVDESDVVAL